MKKCLCNCCVMRRWYMSARNVPRPVLERQKPGACDCSQCVAQRKRAKTVSQSRRDVIAGGAKAREQFIESDMDRRALETLKQWGVR
jgi:hypothetical protein